MNPIIKKWVEKLRSGDYPQGKHALRSASNHYCCLGVLCEVAVEEGIIPKPKLRSTNSANYEFGKHYEDRTSLPPEVSEWSGVNADGTLKNETLYYELMSMNDQQGKTFPEIADSIEKFYTQS